jgi:hypothetical protein
MVTNGHTSAPICFCPTSGGQFSALVVVEADCSPSQVINFAEIRQDSSKQLWDWTNEGMLEMWNLLAR